MQTNPCHCQPTKEIHVAFFVKILFGHLVCSENNHLDSVMLMDVNGRPDRRVSESANVLMLMSIARL